MDGAFRGRDIAGSVSRGLRPRRGLRGSGLAPCGADSPRGEPRTPAGARGRRIRRQPSGFATAAAEARGVGGSGQPVRCLLLAHRSRSWLRWLPTRADRFGLSEPPESHPPCAGIRPKANTSFIQRGRIAVSARCGAGRAARSDFLWAQVQGWSRDVRIATTGDQAWIPLRLPCWCGVGSPPERGSGPIAIGVWSCVAS